MTIEEIKKMADDKPVLDLKVRVISVQKRRSGTGDEGEKWSYQDMQVQDHTGSIWVKCQNKEDLSSLKEEEVILTCYKSESHGWVGLKTFDDEYNEKVTRKLKMTKTGVIINQTKSPKDPETHPDPKPEPQYNQEYLDRKNYMICRQNALSNVVKYSDVVSLKRDELIDLAEEWAFWTFYGKRKNPEKENIKEPF